MPNSLRVLIVDDEGYITIILKNIVEKLGCETDNIDDGRTIGKALFAFDPEVIFLDLMMPDIDGVEVINLLGEAGCKAKIVLMSGLDQRYISSVAEVAKGYNLDVIGAITKPFQPGKIESLIGPLVASKAASAQAASGPKIQRTALPGPRLEFSPELYVDDTNQDNLNWCRIKLGWQLDDEKIVDFSDMLDQSYKERAARGQLNLCFKLLSNNKTKNIVGSDKLGFKISIPDALLLEKSCPDYLEKSIQLAGLEKNKLTFEIDETAITCNSDVILNTLSRLKIKGLRIAIRLHTEIDQILSSLGRLPVDEIVLDMAGAKFSGALLDNQEIEFEIASMVSMANKANLATSAVNIHSANQLALAKQSKFDRISGHAVNFGAETQPSFTV
ncbi:MAG: CheY-like chemotaxis protein [Pseudohongiellaceae bacterium]|jgi:CheY-like chemotaxis protein